MIIWSQYLHIWISIQFLKKSYTGEWILNYQNLLILKELVFFSSSLEREVNDSIALQELAETAYELCAIDT